MCSSIPLMYISLYTIQANPADDSNADNRISVNHNRRFVHLTTPLGKSLFGKNSKNLHQAPSDSVKVKAVNMTLLRLECSIVNHKGAGGQEGEPGYEIALRTWASQRADTGDRLGTKLRGDEKGGL